MTGLAVAASLAGAATTKTTPACPPALVLGTRGAGSGLGVPGQAFAAKLQQLVPGAQSWANPYATTGLAQWPDAFPAIVAQAQAGKKPAGLGGGKYRAAVTEGSAKLVAEIDAVATACPGMTPLILVGDGQGAQVAGDVFQKGLSASQRAAVTAVVLFGDPRFNGADHNSDRGGQGRNGLLGPRPKFPTTKTQPVRSYCHAHDPICQGLFKSGTTFDPTSASLKRHVNYTAYQEPQLSAAQIAKLPTFRLPDALGGVWDGSAGDSQIEIKLSRPVKSTPGTETVTGANACTGQLKLLTRVGTATTFRMSGACPAGKVTLTRTTPDSLQYAFAGTGGGGAVSGVLHRS